MSEKEGKYERWDWSGRHVRIRLEMFVSTLTFFVVSQYKVVGFSFLPVKLDEKTPQISESLVVVFTFLLSLFFIVSFYFRSKNEISESIGVDVVSQKRLDSIDKNLDGISTNLRNVTILNFEKVRVHAVQDIESLKNALVNYQIAKNDLQKNWAGLFAVLDRYHNVFNKNNMTRSRVGSVNSNDKSESSELSPESFIREIKLEAKKIPELDLLYDFAVNAEKLYKNDGALRAVVDASVVDLTYLVEQIDRASAAFNEETRNSLSKQNTEILKFRETVLKKLNSPNRIERMWLAYKLPLIVCSLLFVVSLPFAIGKVFPSLINQKICWCIL